MHTHTCSRLLLARSTSGRGVHVSLIPTYSLVPLLRTPRSVRTHVPLSPLRRYACRNHPAGQVPFFCMGFQKRLQTDDQVYAKVRVTDRVYQNACKPSCVCVCVCTSYTLRG